MNEYEFRALDEAQTSLVVGKVWRLTFMIVALIVLMLFLPWQQTVKGEGRLIALDPAQRDYDVPATIDGFIERFHVREGEKVAAGAPLFAMRDADADYAARLSDMERTLSARKQTTQESIVLLEQRLNFAREALQSALELYAQRYSQADEALRSLQVRHGALQKADEVAQAALTRTRALFEEAIVSKQELEQAENAAVASQSALEQNTMELSIQTRNRAMVQEQKRQYLNETQNQITALENERLSASNQLEQLHQQYQRQSLESARYESATVLAPREGTVVRLLQNETNRYTKKGEPVIHFSPEVTTRVLLMKVSDFNMPLLKAGLPVRIKFYGWPALQISGWPKIRYGTFGGIVKQVDPISYEKGYYYAYVAEDPREPWPDVMQLRLGTQAEAWVALSTVPIWYQIWRLMNAFPPRMVEAHGLKEDL